MGSIECLEGSWRQCQMFTETEGYSTLDLFNFLGTPSSVSGCLLEAKHAHNNTHNLDLPNIHS